VWAASDDGRVYVSDDWDAYAITAVSPSAGTRRVIERDYDPAPRPEWQRALLNVRIDKQEMSPDTKLAETGRTIVDLFPQEDGTLWVLTDRGENQAPAGAMAVFDVFDRDGCFARRVTVDGAYEPGRDELYMHGDFIAVVVNGGPMGGADIFEYDADVPEEVEVRLFEVSRVD
jgi:hypothetical protein